MCLIKIISIARLSAVGMLCLWATWSSAQGQETDLEISDLEAIMNKSRQGAEQTQPSNSLSPARQRQLDKMNLEKKEVVPSQTPTYTLPNTREVNPKDYERLVTLLENEFQDKLDDPRTLLELLIAEGDLALSPNDVVLSRVIEEILLKAENRALVTPDLINKPFMIDPNDRFSTYELKLHASGETLLEFLDKNGDPWPIWDNSEPPGYDVRLGEDHMIWISPSDKYKNGNFFVTLQGYPSPIQFIVKYDNKERHGFVSFKLPLISPTSTRPPPALVSKTRDLEATPSTSQSSVVNTSALSLDVLSYIAETGRMKPNSDISRNAQRLQVNDSSLASVWFYDDQFIVRTPYEMHYYDNMIYGSGGMKVYIAQSLNSVVPLFDGIQDRSLFIPDYHQYVTED
ncbi:DotH/IcmK family type IV secretion protein [Vibrio mediterranei]|uniref:DotH/IcmK family type IV secretion protein n=1 Tax=Vibrio mediterranei TaxID=689 RepID=UPI0038CEA9A9